MSNGNLASGESVMVLHLGLWMNAIYIQSAANGYRVRIGKEYVTVQKLQRRRMALRAEEKLRQKQLTKEKREYGRIS